MAGLDGVAYVEVLDELIESIVRTVRVVPWQVEELTEDQVAEYKETFSLFDRNGDGHISARELGNVLKSVGLNPTDSELKDFINDMDVNENGLVEFPEFLTMMARIVNDEDSDAEIREAFKILDKNSDGMISTAELRYMMVRLGEKVSERDVDEMIRGVDLNRDGLMNYQEFLTLMTRNDKKAEVDVP